jgi:uncharacterized surface protein with fasciclin (FAS1) repeats
MRTLSFLKITGLIILISFSLKGCEIFGLEFQEPYHYDYKAGMPDNRLKQNTLDFIKSRPDLFSILLEAIEYVDATSLYSEKNATYLLPTNTAFNSTNSADLSYFMTHPLLFIGEMGDSTYVTPNSMIYYPKDQVKEFLLYHIVKGKYTWSNLPAEPTWYDTFASADTAKVNMYLLKDRNPNIVFNNFDGHYKTGIKPRTSNLLSNEGAYIHVLDSWLDRPTADILKK